MGAAARLAAPQGHRIPAAMLAPVGAALRLKVVESDVGALVDAVAGVQLRKLSG